MYSTKAPIPGRFRWFKYISNGYLTQITQISALKSFVPQGLNPIWVALF